MNTAYLLMGGNLGDREAYLQKAALLLQKYCGNIILSSSIYETAAWGFTDQPSFFNQAIALETALDPETLMQQLLQIEDLMGRQRLIRMGPRTIDLDILLIDNYVVSSDLLTLPHPFLAQRRFALQPLCEIAPALVHPVLHQTIEQLLVDCADSSNVQKKSAAAD